MRKKHDSVGNEDVMNDLVRVQYVRLVEKLGRSVVTYSMNSLDVVRK